MLQVMIQVREGNPSDAAFIADAQLKMAKESEDLALDLATVTKGVAHVFAHPEIGGYYVAELNGERVGCLLTLFEWSDWRNGNVIWIHSVFVAPEARRLGVYREMYSHLKAKVNASKSLRGLRLYVERTNTRAQQTYEALEMSKEHYELYEWLKSN